MIHLYKIHCHWCMCIVIQYLIQDTTMYCKKSLQCSDLTVDFDDPITVLFKEKNGHCICTYLITATYTAKHTWACVSKLTSTGVWLPISCTHQSKWYKINIYEVTETLLCICIMHASTYMYTPSENVHTYTYIDVW